MALIATFAHLFEVFILACLAIAFGTHVLKWLGLFREGGLEDVLYGAGLFFASLEVILFILATVGWLRLGAVLVILGLAGVVAGRAWLQLPELGRGLVRRIRTARQSPLALLVIALVFLCLSIDALMAMAPLTGSDAMHYHFTTPKLTMGHPLAPIFWLDNSFLVGQAHLLISLGMALGSDRVSLGLIYLGGVLTAASVFVLTRKLAASEGWAWVAALTFLLTPMVYWQMSTSGSPDIWMAFYAVLVLLAAARAVETGNRRWWFLAGIFAGAVAGAKYTGWVIPLALVGCCFLALRSWRWASLCGLCSLPTGILPLVRNASWTGDPFFPFLTRWLNPGSVNSYALAALMADTHAGGFDRSLAAVVRYPFTLAIRGNSDGVGQYFGPLVLAFAPLLLLSFRKGFLSRAAAGIWVAVLLSNALTCQMARFLLPAFPLALALVLAGVAESFRRGWKFVRAACCATMVLFLVFGMSAEALYARDFLPVVMGLEKQDAFLERMAPDYGTAAFINRSVHGQGKVMVFFRHLYYLNAPFVEGRPENSWLMDPKVMADPEKLLDLLRREKIRWIVKSPDYPQPLAPAFQALEAGDRLRPTFSIEASTFSGFRIHDERVRFPVVILEVAPVPPAEHPNGGGNTAPLQTKRASS